MHQGVKILALTSSKGSWNQEHLSNLPMLTLKIFESKKSWENRLHIRINADRNESLITPALA